MIEEKDYSVIIPNEIILQNHPNTEKSNLSFIEQLCNDKEDIDIKYAIKYI